MSEKINLGKRWCSYFLVITVFLQTQTHAQWLIQSKNDPSLKFGFDKTTERYDAWLQQRGNRFLVHQTSLSKDPGSVSFESVDYPGRYLRHAYNVLYAEYRDGSELFDNDASFYVHVNIYSRNYYSFESVNYKGNYISHIDNRLQISTDINLENMSFRYLQENIMLEPRATDGCAASRCRVSQGSGERAFLQNKGEIFNMISPGLNGQHMSVAFEDADRPGYYLRDYGQYGFIESSNTSRSPYTFTQDTGFFLRPNRFSYGYYGIESAKYNGKFLRALGNEVKFNSQDGTNNYPSEASFRIVEGPVYLESQNMAGYKMGLNGNNEAVMTESGTRWNLIYPGLSGHPVTISIESYDLQGYFLRHYDYKLDLEDRSNPRNPGIFDFDATFLLRKDIWYDDFSILESVNYRNCAIRHSDSRLQIAQYESGSDIYKGDASYKITEAPLGTIPGDGGGSSDVNVGAIVGGVIGLLLLVVLIVGAVFMDRRYHWSDAVKAGFKKSGSSSDTSGGIDNPVYPQQGNDVEQPQAKASSPAKPVSTSSTVTSSVPTTPTTPTGDPFNDSGSSFTNSKVRKLGRRLSDSVSKLKRSSSRNSNDDRRIEMPESFDLSMKDFQPGFDREDSKGSFDNPMYGLKRLSQVESTDDEPDSVSPVEQSSSSVFKRHDSLIDSSPTLTAMDSDNTMSYFDQVIEEVTAGEELDLGDTKEEEQGSNNEEEYATVDKSKKKISAGIKPITEDDLWDITDA